jgi:hypothetical protein
MALWVHAPKAQGYIYESQNFITVRAIEKIHILI